MTAETGAEKQIVSRARVRSHGEVYTAKREVRAMCDLVENEARRIDSRVLEPACGNGNFLEEILSRKLATAAKDAERAPRSFAFASIRALMSIYGVDIIESNVEECRRRLHAVWEKKVRSDGIAFAGRFARLPDVARFVLAKNILHGNTLTMKLVDENGEDVSGPIVFTEWTFPGETKVNRREFRLDHVLLAKTADAAKPLELFDKYYVERKKGENGDVLHPVPLKTRAAVDYLLLGTEQTP